MPLFSGDDLNRMLELARILTVNDYEASVIEQRTGRAMADIATKLDAVVVTRGAQGASLYANGTETAIEAVAPEAVVDPTGCGDAHRAGLLYGLVRGWELADACRLASLMGAIKVASQGPQNHAPSRAQIASKLKDAFGLAL
jgi:adenosine kinase